MTYDYLVIENRAAFLARVTEIAAVLGVSPDWLMIVFKIESNINPAAINPYTGATGLIQFMPATAAGLGTSCAALAEMGNVRQLDYVLKYFKPYAGKITGVVDLYTITFFPRALGKPDEYILKTDTVSAGTIAHQNAPYDINKNGEISAGELRQSIVKRIPGDVVYAMGAAADYLKKN